MGVRAFRLIIGAACLFIAPTLAAHDICKQECREGLTVGIARSALHYQETTTTGARLNTENGTLAGLVLSANVLPHKALAAIPLTLNLLWYKNTVRYVGYSNLGRLITTKTDELIGDMQLRYDYPLPQGALASRLNVGVGYRYWRRNIHDAPKATGLLEQYHWPYLMVGMQRTLFFERKNTGLEVDLALRHSVFPRIHVAFPNTFDAVWVSQGRVWGAVAKISFFYPSKNRRWALTPYVDIWQAQRGKNSPLRVSGSVVGVVTEPESFTRVTGAVLSVSF